MSRVYHRIRSEVARWLKTHSPSWVYQSIRWGHRIITGPHRIFSYIMLSTYRRHRFKHEFRRKAEQYIPRIGMHTVFIAKENILFLEEWILYHRALGVDHFFLHDNSAVEITQGGFLDEKAWVGKVAKRGIPYDYLVTMTDEDIASELERLQREIPNVHIYTWSPVGKDGKIEHKQSECQTVAAKAHQQTVDWMLFMDVDEYFVSTIPLPDLCVTMTREGYIGAEFWEHRMDNRYKHLDKRVCDIDIECWEKHPKYDWHPSGKILCYLSMVKSVHIHHFRPFVPRMKLNHAIAHYRHYKCHPLGESVSTVVPLNAQVGRDPSWKLDRVRSDWREVIAQTQGDAGYLEAWRLSSDENS